LPLTGPICPGTSAEPTAYLQDVISSSRETGRSIAVLTATSVHAVSTYLAKHGLDKEFAAVFASADLGSAPQMLKAQLIEEAARELGADLAACALVTSTAADFEATRTTGTHSVGYAKTPDERAHLSAAGAEAVISTMADLALRLRARPASPEL
jgi:beta-phosphoglucomutase-like phosphatase (HAD superfamily)